jgi:hypothetical protein
LNNWTREYCGVLTSDLRVGACLSVMLDSSNCLLSAKIRTIEPRADKALLVETRHSTYLVREVDGCGPQFDDGVPVRKTWRASA